MAAAAKSITRKAPARKAVTTTARVRGNSDARDAVMRAAEQAQQNGHVHSEEQPKVANIHDVELLAEDLSDNFLRCRDFGHQWKMANAKKVGRTWERTMYCPSCKYNKHQVLDSHGVIITEKPDYPDGYLIKGMGRINGDGKAVLRLASTIRVAQKTAATRKG
jgi:hypothetical protein